MNIVSLAFAGFCACLFAVYWVMPVKGRPYVLAAGNIWFALGFGAATLPVLCGVALLCWLGAKILLRRPSRGLYALLLVLVALPLLVYKYLAPLSGYLAQYSSWVFPAWSNALGALALPMGISYFTFRGMYYLGYSYKNKQAEASLLHCFNYVSFFAMLVSGPIQAPRSQLPQLRTPPPFSASLALTGCGRILWGLVLKIVMADRLAMFQPGFDDFPILYSLSMVWALVAYSLQLYCDFAGYSQMAIGVANLLGYTCEENFISPYFSRSIAEFWRRWHISLSTFLREMIYIPMGGSRRGLARWTLAVLVTFVVSGVWHGAGPVFALWGLWHAVCLIAGRYTLGVRKKVWGALRLKPDGLPLRLWQTLFTFVLVAFGWQMFKVGSQGGDFAALAATLGYYAKPLVFSLQYVKESFVLIGFTTSSLVFTAAMLLVLFGVDAASHKLGFGAWYTAQKPWFRRVFAACCLGAAMFLSIVDGGSFIYFKF